MIEAGLISAWPRCHTYHLIQKGTDGLKWNRVYQGRGVCWWGDNTDHMERLHTGCAELARGFVLVCPLVVEEPLPCRSGRLLV